MAEAHDQPVTHHYTVRFPSHEARENDPHYRDFDAFRRRTQKTAQCAVGSRRGDFSDCSLDKPLELHHAHIEFALLNNVDLALLERQYPGVSDPDQVGAWIESADNLEWLCEFHHRGHGGAHVASAADFEAQNFIKGLIQ